MGATLMSFVAGIRSFSSQLPPSSSSHTPYTASSKLPIVSSSQPIPFPSVPKPFLKSGSSLETLVSDLISNCQSVDELSVLVESHGDAFNNIHTSASLSKMEKILQRALRPGVVPEWPLMGRLVQLLEKNMKGLQAREVANSLNSLAKIRWEDDAIVWRLIQRGTCVLSDFNPQDLANTFWAMAMLGHHDSAFISALLSTTRSRLHELNSRDLANTIWAMAKLEHHDSAFISALLSVARSRLHEFKPHNLTKTIWAMATLDHHDSAFISAILSAAKSQLHEFNPQNLANTIWAMATLDHHDSAFTSALLSVARSRLHEFNPQNLANTLWAMAVLGHVNTHLAHEVMLLLVAKYSQLNEEQRRQLLYSAMWLFDLEVVLGDLRALCAEAIIKVKSDLPMVVLAPEPSKIQQDVFSIVATLPGISGAKLEQSTDDGLLSIDIAITLPTGEKVAIEVDGPTHFLHSYPPGLMTYNGNTLLRNRLLEARGWRVISVPVVEWRRLKGRGGKVAYLQRLLAI